MRPSRLRRRSGPDTRSGSRPERNGGAASPTHRPAYHHQTGSVLAVPLVTQGDAVLGVLGLLFRREHALQREERQLATTMGQHAAQAFERANLFESERQLAERAIRAAGGGVRLRRRYEHDRGRRCDGRRGSPPPAGPFRPGRGRGCRRQAAGPSALGPAGSARSRTRCIELGIAWPGDDAIATRGVVRIRDLDEGRVRYPEAIDDDAPALVWMTVPLLNESGAIGFVHLSFEPPGPSEELQGAIATLVCTGVTGDGSRAPVRTGAGGLERPAAQSPAAGMHPDPRLRRRGSLPAGRRTPRGRRRLVRGDRARPASARDRDRRRGRARAGCGGGDGATPQRPPRARAAEARSRPRSSTGSRRSRSAPPTRRCPR